MDALNVRESKEDRSFRTLGTMSFSVLHAIMDCICLNSMIDWQKAKTKRNQIWSTVSACAFQGARTSRTTTYRTRARCSVSFVASSARIAPYSMAAHIAMALLLRLSTTSIIFTSTLLPKHTRISFQQMKRLAINKLSSHTITFHRLNMVDHQASSKFVPIARESIHAVTSVRIILVIR